MSATRKTVLIMGSAIVALLVAVLVVAVLILNSLNAPSGEDRFWACMAEKGFGEHETIPPDKSYDDLSAAGAECEEVR